MHRLTSLSIRVQMVVLIIIMSIAPFWLICQSTLKQRSHEIADAMEATAKVANQIQIEQEHLTSGIEQLAVTLEQLPEVKKHDTSVVAPLLSEVLRVNPKYFNIFITDNRGVLWASALPSETGLSFADRRYFRNAVTSGKISSGEFVISKSRHIPVFSFAYPITNQTGTVQDVLVVSFPLENYRQFFSDENDLANSSILLTDHKGTILYSSVSPELLGAQDRSDLFRQMTDGPEEGNFEAKGNRNTLRFFHYKKMRLKNESVPYMYIRTGLSKDGVLGRVNKEFTTSITVLAVAMLLSLGLVIYVCKRGIYDRIVAIRAATRSIARGKLDTRIGPALSGGELGELAQAFDTMAEQLSADAIDLAKAYEAQKASELKYRELVENANSIILKWDQNGCVTYCNEFAERFFGYSCDELLGCNIIGTIVPENESSGRNLAELMNDICKNPGAFINNENENIRKNGERVWVSWNNHQLTDSNGNPAGILSVGQDITERKRIESKLQKSEIRFRSFVENVNDVLFALTPSGTFSYVSPQWKTAFGYELSETIGKPFEPFVHPDDVAGCFAFLKRVFETDIKQSGVEYRVLCKNGSYVWYKANASRIVDPANGTPTLVGIGRDITERKQAEDTLRLSEEKFSAAFRASPDAITLSRLSDGKYLEVNDGFTSLTGYSIDEALGHSSTDLKLWIDQKQRKLLLQELVKSGTAKGVEAQFRRKDGTSLVGQIAARIISIKGEPYIISVTRDITEQENIQNELVKAQKLESISILAGGIAHNFNNVLTGVIGYISYARKHLHDPEKIGNILESAEKSSYRAAGLARQLLTFSRGTTPVRKALPVDALVQESVSLFLSGTNVKGNIDCSSHQTVLVDSQQINQVFNNIVLNALQAMPNGGTLTVQASTVRLGTGNKYRVHPAIYVRITFTDTGTGISPEDIGRIFDPYFTTKENGTGLGLSTSHSIISKHGGCIDVASRDGAGTAVSIFLPAVPETATQELSNNSPVYSTPKDLSLLVMDDDETIREVIGNILVELGYRATTCKSGEEAVNLYKTALESGSPFSAVIMDLIVPGAMGGTEAAGLILDLDPHARLLVSSGYSNNPVIDDFTSYGFCGKITKPYNVDELNKTLQDIFPDQVGK